MSILVTWLAFMSLMLLLLVVIDGIVWLVMEHRHL